MERIKRFSEDYYAAVAAECEKMLFASIPDNEAVTPPHIFSERFERRMEEVFRTVGRRERRISKRGKIIIAVAAAVIVMLFTALSVGAVRESLYRLFFLEKNTSYAVFQYRPAEENMQRGPERIETVYRPKYIPEGYVQTEELIFDFNHTITYTKGVVDYEFNQTTFNYTITVNMENVEAETVRINGCDVFFVVDKEDSHAFWCNDEYMFTVRGVISRDELEKVVRSVAKS